MSLPNRHPDVALPGVGPPKAAAHLALHIALPHAYGVSVGAVPMWTALANAHALTRGR